MAEKNKNPQDVQYSKKKIRVALLCISAVLIFYIGANFLKGVSIFHKKAYYYCVMEDASGVQQNTPVYLAGYKIGQVQEVELLSANPPRICAKIMLSEPIDLPKDSQLKLKSSSILGGMQLDVVLGKATAYFQSNDTIKCFKEAGMLDGIDGLKDKIGSVLASVDTIGLEIKDLMHKDGGGESLRNTLANIEDATDNLNSILADNKDEVGDLLASLKRFGTTLDNASPKLNAILEDFDNIADTVAKADIAGVITNVNRTINEVETLVKKASNGDGTVGALLNDDGLVKKIDEAIKSLDTLLKDVKDNPRHYLAPLGEKKKKSKK
ncbi:MAG: MlaD family protein [Bacteroidales bacterium]|nr:MlaD family protein [Bacteroidales bacterium]